VLAGLTLAVTVATVSAHAHGPHGRAANRGAAHLDSESARLRADILDEYQQMRASGAFSGSTFGSDISSVVQHHIKVGTDFAAAEDMLRRAGFTVNARPGLTTEATGEDRYDVYASSLTLIPGPQKVEVRVGLRPDSPADYQEVSAVRAWILVTSAQGN
jgi:hypothetical protein